MLWQYSIQAQEYEDWDSFDPKQRCIIGWIMALISLNFFFIFFKCFIRSISTITSHVDKPDEFDHIHKYRFLVYSIIDILNGFSILYAFYCMGQANLKRKTTPMTSDIKQQLSSQLVAGSKIYIMLGKQEGQDCDPGFLKKQSKPKPLQIGSTSTRFSTHHQCVIYVLHVLHKTRDTAVIEPGLIFNWWNAFSFNPMDATQLLIKSPSQNRNSGRDTLQSCNTMAIKKLLKSDSAFAGGMGKKEPVISVQKGRQLSVNFAAEDSYEVAGSSNSGDPHSHGSNMRPHNENNPFLDVDDVGDDNDETATVFRRFLQREIANVNKQGLLHRMKANNEAQIQTSQRVQQRINPGGQHDGAPGQLTSRNSKMNLKPRF